MNESVFSVSPESSQLAADGGRGGLQPPHTGIEAESDGERTRERVLAVKLDLRDRDATYRRLVELSWQAARYRNLQMRAKWAEATKLCVDPVKGIPHDVSKHVRGAEKGELSGAAYSAAEREVQGAWQRHGRRILAGGPLPEWRPTAALTIRGHKRRSDSGVQLMEVDGRIWIRLKAQADKCEGGCAIDVPLAVGSEKDWQVDLLRSMVSGAVAIGKGTVQIKPFRHRIIVRLTYKVAIALPRFGNRAATLGPIRDGARLTLRTETETRDYTARLHSLLERKDQWEKIRRRAGAQFGRSKGSARAKRRKFSQWSWQDWLDTHLHQWSREIIDWLDSQGIAKLSVIGLGTEDWPVYRFTQLLKYKGEEKGIAVDGEADLAEAGTERAINGDLGHQRRKATKRAAAIRTLTSEAR